MKKFKSVLWLMLIIMVSVTVCSCGSDEPDVPTYASYFIECTNVEGGGLTNQECVKLKSDLNVDLTDKDMSMNGITRESALLIFDEVMQVEARELSTLRPQTPLYITFSMRTENGISVKSTTLVATKDGCQVN
ncbi:MAG: hypothetical protein NC114_11295 [Ruminococcus flavefaciens]|nr:hypothetical protein [Ruminococcus flavefaciens]